MGKKSIKKNYFFNVSYQILLLLTPFITTPYISRVLGADGVGKVSYAESIVSYFALFAILGISTHGQRAISYVQSQKYERSVVFWNTKILEFFTSGLAFLAYLGLAIMKKSGLIYIILSINILSVFIDISWFFNGMEEFGKSVLRNALFKILNIIYIFVFIKSKSDLAIYVFGLAIFTFLGNISMWWYLPRYICKVPFAEIHPFKDIKIVLSLFIPTVAIQIYTVLDKTMIGIITKDAFENGYYEQALKLSKIVLMVVASLGTVMIPRIGFYYKNGDEDEVKKLMYRGYHFVWFLGIPLCFGLMMISKTFVPWFFGDGYEKVVILLRILSILILAIGINNVTGMQYLIPTERQNIFTLTVIIGAVTNLMLNALLIPKLQSIGAAIASITAESVIAIVQLIFVRREISPCQVIKEGKSYFMAGIVMLMPLLIESVIFDSSFLNTVIMVITGIIVYMGVLLIVKDEFLLNNIQTILKKIFMKC